MIIRHAKTFLITLILLPIFCLNLYAGERVRTVEEMAKALVQGLAGNLTESPLNVQIGKLTIESTNYSSEFADVFWQHVESELKKHKSHFNKVSRVRIRTRDLSLNATRVQSESHLKYVVLEGSYREDSSKGLVILSAYLADRNNSTVSAYEVEIDKSALNQDLKPQNLSKIQETEEKIGTAPSKKDFNLDLWIDRGNGGIYRAGESISAMVRTEVDCYLKVLYIDANGNRVLMFPAESDSHQKLKKGVIYRLDENNTYKVIPPFGSEMILAFASTAPFGDAGEISLGEGFRGFSSNKKTSEIVRSLRGISVSEKKNALTMSMHSKRSEARVYLTTVRKR